MQAGVNRYVKLVSKAFEIKGDDVIINLPHPYPPFLAILAHTSNVSAIIDKKWGWRTARGWEAPMRGGSTIILQRILFATLKMDRGHFS